MVPGTLDTAYVCLRAPLAPVTGRALSIVVPVTNLSVMSVGGATPGQAAFGEPFELFLGGRAVRGIEGGPDGFLLTAGPVDNRPATAPHIYKLFSWSGQPDDPPQERSADLTFLNPEGVVNVPPAPWTAASKIQVVSDTGRLVYYGDGVAAKLLPKPAFKKFRSDWIEIGEVVDARPRIETFRVESEGGELSWFAQTGRTYRVQATSAAFPWAWTGPGEEVLADVPLMQYFIPAPVPPGGAYRLERLPP